MPYYLLILLLGMLQSLKSYGQYKSELRFQNDNDVYLLINQDQYYTNGLSLSYLHAWNRDNRKQLVELQVGQQIYNGVELSANGELRSDMPFTGYLYGSIAWTRFIQHNKLLRVGVEMAQIGDKSYGQEAQEYFHKALNFYAVQGWENRLSNAFGADLQVSFQQQLLEQLSKKYSLTFSAAARLGMHHTDLELALPFRWGRIHTFRESVSTNGHLGKAESSDSRGEFFGFYRPAVHWQGYNATMQGGLFAKDAVGEQYQPKPFFFSHELGLKLQKKHWNLAFSYQFNSRISESAIYRHQYGKLIAGYLF
ncbi:lipid A deacylase LpxR family protein [Rhinopithecimicrobium faecis]